MRVFLLLSFGLRLPATGWSLFLLWRMREWRLGFLSCALGFMAAQIVLPSLLRKYLM